MKKTIYLIFLICNLSIAQNGFIQVEVKDSIRLTPEKIEYNVQISSDELSTSQFGAVDRDSMKIRMTEKYKKLESFLNERKYQIRPLNNDKYTIHDYAGFWKYGFAVELNNSNEVEKLTNELKSLPFITGSIGKIDYKDNKEGEKRLFDKIIQKAQEKAETISKFSGQTLGKITEITESPEFNNVEFNILDTYFRTLQQDEISIDKNNVFGQKWKSFTIRFATN